ncbi:MAG TPA: DUF697 domain-containing protein, partial [Thiotrichales bacterium]|nr:DUF697 domain-containing protein [Thiotrichales bacterium]
KKVRRLLAFGVVMFTLLLLLFIFVATRTALDLWERLQSVPAPLFYTYASLIGLLVLASLWLVYKLLRPVKTGVAGENKPLSEERLQDELAAAEDAGMETAELRRELERLQQRKQAGRIHVALFGNISTGKSSIIRALLPDARIEHQVEQQAAPAVDVQGGTTQRITRYTWQSESGDSLILTDLPGRSEAGGSLDEMARDEAVRAQIVIYVTDSDLSRQQFDDIVELQRFGKPMIVALNKSDRFSEQEQQQLRARFAQYFGEHTNKAGMSASNTPAEIKLVFVTSGGEEEVLRVNADGSEEKITRPRAADVSALAQALQTEIDAHRELLESLRDASVFVLVKQKLDADKRDFQQQQAEAIIKRSTRKAIIGALAALSPGSDLVIQAVLGTQMVKQLCQLYQVPVRQLDIDKLLELSTGTLRKNTSLLLAVAGNGMKAFPGVGTITGGLTHAVAYGLIFDALGHAVAKTLQQRGKLQPAPVALTFNQMLGENLESRARNFARLVLDSRND